MGTLAAHLQEAFATACPPGWSCRPEQPLVGREAARRLGFEPRADVLLQSGDGSHRIWVEFEVSRADPVANHAKFATARFLEPDGSEDTFVSMASRHIAPGRLALAAGTAMLMRSAGIAAFQIGLLPQLDGPTIKRLNASPRTDLARLPELDARPEIRRLLGIASGETVGDRHRIHKADNPWAVAVNARRWNAEIATARWAEVWGSRAVRYLVHDPETGLFAPSKFCAFVPAATLRAPALPPARLLDRPPGMTIEVYAMLGEDDPRFDGHVARTHLERALGYRAVRIADADERMREAFARWHDPIRTALHVRADPVALLPPGPDLPLRG